jgi:predicted PurR-regulated permease PerM
MRKTPRGRVKFPVPGSATPEFRDIRPRDARHLSCEVVGMNDWPRSLAPVLVLTVATVAGVYACYRLVLPFVPAFAWALTAAVLFAPVHRWNEARVKRSNVAAGISVIMVVVIVVVPGILVAGRLMAEAAHGAFAIRTAIDSGEWQRAIEDHPRLALLADWVGRQLNLPDLIGSAASWLTNMSASLVRGSIAQAAVFLLTFYFLYYFLRDRGSALASLRNLSPLSNEELAKVTTCVADTIHAIFYGTLVCAAVQGALGGLMFWWLGLPAPLLWGVIMGLLAIVPVFGAFVVWIPAAAFLALNGHWVQAAILTVWGSVVIAGIDNVLYPILVGNRLRLHTVPAFVSVVGGLVVFGASGVILGPLVVTITLTLLEIWQTRASFALETAIGTSP